MAEAPRATGYRREQYLQMMRKAQQLGDRRLLRLILKKLGQPGKNGAGSTTDDCVVIPFSAFSKPVQVISQRPRVSILSDTNSDQGRRIMDKKILIYFGIVVLVVIGVAVYLGYYFDREALIHRGAMPRLEPVDIVGMAKALGIGVLGAICGIFIAGPLYGFILGKIRKGDRVDAMATENHLYSISVETGRNEYDLFIKAAEEWGWQKGESITISEDTCVTRVYHTMLRISSGKTI